MVEHEYASLEVASRPQVLVSDKIVHKGIMQGEESPNSGHDADTEGSIKG